MKNCVLTIEVEDDKDIKLVNNGTYNGFNWFKLMSIRKIKDLVLSRFAKETN